jgi:UDP-N-acetylmuramyl pentapeptide phosphotransferase/UDP-N-acetylglucosamine-1-phosphate transferase
MDGLMGGTAIISFLGMLLIFYMVSFPRVDIIITVLVCIGAIAGFLVWNAYPAKIFFGDSGSLPIGMLIGIIIVESMTVDSRLGFPLVLVSLVPFFETGFLFIERIRKGLKFYRGSPDHFALRLLNHGYGVPSIVLRVMVVNLGLVLSAFLITKYKIDSGISIVTILILSVCVIIAYRYLHALPVREINE